MSLILVHFVRALLQKIPSLKLFRDEVSFAWIMDTDFTIMQLEIFRVGCVKVKFQK